MLTKIYSVYDVKTRFYHPVFHAHNENDAMRSLRQLLMKENKYSQFPEDYRLVELGTFDDSIGKIAGYKVPLEIAALLELYEETNVNKGNT